MPSYLPKQESRNHTVSVCRYLLYWQWSNMEQYYNAGIACAIDRLGPQDHEAAVSAIWIAILSFTFPPLKGYLIRPEQATAGGFADLYMVHFDITVTPISEYHFCIVQCKRVSAEGQASAWDEGRSQLRGYLPNLKPRNRAHPVYGAVAVGRWVEFYQYDRDAATGNEPLQRLGSSTGMLHIARQCGTIQGILEGIKSNHT